MHNGYASGPVNQSIKKDMLNTWQQDDYKESYVKKLITSFKDKENYGINYRLLKLYIQLGIKITKINRVLEYSQDNNMKPYIMLNTKQRTKSKTKFEKDFYKLMNNSVYGKTMENVRNCINFKLISTEEQVLALHNTRIKHTIFNENLIGMHLPYMVKYPPRGA